MKLHIFLRLATVALALSVGVAPGALAQEGPALTGKDAKKLAKKTDKDLKKARKANQRAQEARRDVEKYVNRYTENLERMNRALAHGNLREEDALEVAARVDEATLKHEPILEGLLETAPEQARPAVERALAASRTGHDTATEAIVNHGRVSLPDGRLDSRAAQAAMRKNDALLRHAERARKRGDNGTMRRSVDQYTANMSAVSRAIESGGVEESEALSVLDRVDRNTRRHISTLEGLLGEVPEQAQAGIQKALEASRKGNQAATAAISRTPAAGVQTGRAGSPRRPSGAGGSATAGGGRPSGVGGGASGGKRKGPPR
ncbi:MAG: hypothetical protein ACE5HB_01735 [Terriglobia bacterium]